MYVPSLARTKATGADDDDPNTPAPAAAEVFAVDADLGYRCSLEFDAGETCDVTIWFFNETSDRWVSTSTLTGVGPDQAFGDPGSQSDIRSGRIWVQLTNISGGAPIDVYIARK